MYDTHFIHARVCVCVCFVWYVCGVDCVAIFFETIYHLNTPPLPSSHTHTSDHWENFCKTPSNQLFLQFFFPSVSFLFVYSFESITSSSIYIFFPCSFPLILLLCFQDILPHLFSPAQPYAVLYIFSPPPSLPLSVKDKRSLGLLLPLDLTPQPDLWTTLPTSSGQQQQLQWKLTIEKQQQQQKEHQLRPWLIEKY